MAGLVGAAGIEPATLGLEIQCSIRLSYAPKLAGFHHNNSGVCGVESARLSGTTVTAGSWVFLPMTIGAQFLIGHSEISGTVVSMFSGFTTSQQKAPTQHNADATRNDAVQP